MPKQKQPKKRKVGRPFQDFTERLTTRVSPETKRWIEHLRAAKGLREGDILRRIVDDARTAGWGTP